MTQAIGTVPTRVDDIEHVDSALRATVRSSLGDDRHVDAWMARMEQNCLDAATEADADDMVPVRRIGLHSGG